jgi:hypothetical protein
MFAGEQDGVHMPVFYRTDGRFNDEIEENDED